VTLSFASTDYRRHPVSATILSLSGLALGFGLGTAAFRWKSSFLLALVPIVEPIGQLWLNALLMITLPLVISLLLATVVGAGRSRQAGKLGGYTLLWFVLLLVVTGLGTIAAGSAIVSWFPVDTATRTAFQASLLTSNAPTPRAGPTGSMKDWLVNLIPGNLIHAIGDGEILPVIVAAFLFAMAVRGIPEERRLLLHKFFQAVSESTLRLAGFILRVLPLAVFSLTFVASARSGPVIAGGVAYYVVAVTILLIVAIVLLYPLTWWLGRISIRRFAVGVFPCQAIAVASRSSLATLPSLLDRGESRIGLPAPVATFVLPLAATVFKLNRTISSPLKVIILGHLYGLTVDSGMKFMFVLIATVLSFGSPGLPSGGSLVTLPLYLAAGLPLQGIVLLNAVDSIPDVFKTLLNVTADMSVATIVARFAGFHLTPAAERVPVAPISGAPEADVSRAP
jgi:proton glutamate symport protein